MVGSSLKPKPLLFIEVMLVMDLPLPTQGVIELNYYIKSSLKWTLVIVEMEGMYVERPLGLSL